MMRKVLCFLAGLALMISCTGQLSSQKQELSFDELFVLREQIQQRLDECEAGTTDGTYPEESFPELEKALAELNEGIAKARAGAFILQFEIDSYALAAQKAINLFDDSIIKIVLPGRPAELFVNGIDHKGWIDFGASPDYCGGPQFTIDVWTKYNENFIEFTFGSFISTFYGAIPYRGWSLHYWGTSNSAIRFTLGTDNPNPDLTLPVVYTGAPSTYGEWVHYAAVFDSSNDFMGLYINGSLAVSTTVADELVPNEQDPRMWAFVEPTDHSRCISGYIKNFRLWNKALSADEVRQMMNTEVDGTEDRLLCAWDFTEKPEDDTNIIDKTGKHTARIEGVYKWTEITE